MALLDAAGRARVARRWMKENEQPVSVTKADIVAAVAAVDDHREATWAEVNTSVPQPTRGALTRRQKARLFAICIEEAFKLEN